MVQTSFSLMVKNLQITFSKNKLALNVEPFHISVRKRLHENSSQRFQYNGVEQSKEQFRHACIQAVNRTPNFLVQYFDVYVELFLTGPNLLVVGWGKQDQKWSKKAVKLHFLHVKRNCLIFILNTF